jgi:hypothetical protein
VAELDLQQARYEASLAERRYAACDPDNRLIAAQLEKSWEAALRRVEACEARVGSVSVPAPAAAMPDFTGLADDLQAAWNASGVTTRTRQRLLRTLVVDIIADVDEAAREVILTIHWRGGQHSQLRLTKPKSGEHGCRTPEEAMAVICSMATRWSDAEIAASLNRMGNAHWAGQVLDRASCQLAAPGSRHPRLPVGRERLRMADAVRSRDHAGHHAPPTPAPHRERFTRC